MGLLFLVVNFLSFLLMTCHYGVLLGSPWPSRARNGGGSCAVCHWRLLLACDVSSWGRHYFDGLE